MRRSRKEESPAEELADLLSQIINAVPVEDTTSITVRHGLKLGKPNTRFGPRTSVREGCIECPNLGASRMAYAVPSMDEKDSSIAISVEWPKGHKGLYVLLTPGSFIDFVLHEQGITPTGVLARFAAYLEKLTKKPEGHA